MRDDIDNISGIIRYFLIGEDDGAVVGLELGNGLPVLTDQHETDVRVVDVLPAEDGSLVDQSGVVGSAVSDERVLLHHATREARDLGGKFRGVVGAIDGDGDFRIDELAAFGLHLHLEDFGFAVSFVHGLDDIFAVLGQDVGVGAVFIDCECTERFVDRISFLVRDLVADRPLQLALALVLGIDHAFQLQLSTDGRKALIVAAFRDIILNHRSRTGLDDRNVRRSDDVDDELAGAVGPFRVFDADGECFLL